MGNSSDKVSKDNQLDIRNPSMRTNLYYEQ